MSPRNPPQYPDPFTVPPRSGHHTQTFIVLHGRGSNGESFGTELLRTAIPGFSTLPDAFPDAKFIFPTAAKRRAQIYKRTPIHQWFDNWKLFPSATEREELQFEGLRESSAFVHGLLEREIQLVGALNVILWGLSQGCATSLTTLLLWQGPEIAATIGMCGWLPLRKRLEDAAFCAEESTHDADDPFAPDAGESGDPATVQSNFAKAVAYLRDELDLTPSSRPPMAPQIPVFLGHGTEDEKVPVQLNREAAALLRLLEVDVEYREYEDLGHWYSGPMLRDILVFIQTKTRWKVVSADELVQKESEKQEVPQSRS